ncbi:hypothetical protein MPTK1_4g10070 [Marchantia polymorpha subsp. ruderalis]
MIDEPGELLTLTQLPRLASALRPPSCMRNCFLATRCMRPSVRGNSVEAKGRADARRACRLLSL